MRWLLAIALVGAGAGRAHANAAAPWHGGSYAAELDGTGAIAIAHEELVIDMRPLADDKLVAVSATYHLDNPGDAKHVELVFAAGSTIERFHVAFDGKQVATTRAWSSQLGPGWAPPKTTPLFDGDALGYELRDGPDPVGFALDVPNGRHELAITYGADAIRYHSHDPTLLRQFAYVLAPARSWASFGGLDVSVHVPASWRVAVTPQLARDGDTLHAAFATVPADAIALTVQAPAGAAYTIVVYATRVLFVLVGLAGAFVIAWRTRVCERRRQWRHKWISLGRGVAWGLALLGTGLLAVFAPDGVLAAGQADEYGYGQAFAFIGVVLAALVALAIGTIVSLVVGHRVHAARID